MSVHTEHDDQDQDIYRGEPPSQDLPAPALAPSITSNSSASSSSSSLAGGRLGAIAAKLELAISRWARNVKGTSSAASTASSSSSSSSSCSSVVTLTKSQIARRRRKRRSISSLRPVLSDRDIAARITRMKALEKSREIPREFALYLPPSMMPAYLQPLITQSEPVDIDAKNEAKDRRITWTTSLPLVLSHLDLATRSSGRRRRVRQKHKGGPNADPSRPTSSSYFQTEVYPETSLGRASKSVSPGPASRGRKGKHRATSANGNLKPTPVPEEPPTKPEAWFLDVANPTWADLKAIGQVLHIHPLTLEDILQQDPREKLEIFSKLGYYFISFRAIESQATREKLQREAGLKDTPGYNKTLVNDDGSIGEANVYLTVFKDGICCFHFTDVSEHTDRVRNRMVLLEEVVNLSSDWIAHDIIDSIVDSFFPFVDDIEKEVTAIDHMIYLGEAGLLLPSGPRIDVALSKSPTRDSLMPSLKTEDTPGSQSTAVTQPSPEGEEEKTPEEKYTPAEKLRDSYRPRFVSPRLTIRLLFRRVRWYVGCAWRALWERSERPPSPRQLTVRRMARTRKLVTVLGRLLATKSDVVTQIRKRLTKAAAGAHGSEEFEVAIYMGDVHDHILMLQHSLDHYALMLSQSHPTYLSQLRMEFDKTKNVADRKLLLLTIITIACLCIGILTGLFSLNVNVPTNNHDPKTGKFNLFGIILTMDILIILTLLAVVRYWWKKAKRRRRPLF